MNYRPEIDGLRAFAVIVVILFHAGLTVFSGGYMGVDVFFVISGYLITSILLNDLKQDKFSIKAFYERRARRILPALFVVIFTTFIGSYLILAPDPFMKMARSAGAAILSVSNILFWQEADYFNESGALKPLLHTWSLGLEEQFYIFFPPLLFIVWKYMRKYLGLFLGLGFIGSLLMAEYMLFHGHITGNFYLLPMRGWELIAGGYVAYYETKTEKRLPDKWRSSAGVVGFLMVLASVLFLDENTPHPGLWTLLPVIGTTLVLHYGSVGIVKQILSLRIFVMIGLISYSLYLWHQPVFALFRAYSFDAPGAPEYTALIGVSVALGYLSYKYVETPFRNRQKFSIKFIWAFSALSSFALLALAGTVYVSGGLPGRFSEEYAHIFKARLSRSEDMLRVDGRLCRDRDFEDSCVIGDRSKKAEWALIGDSHAGTIGVSLDRDLREKGLSALFLVQAGCTYVPGGDKIYERKLSCSEFTKKAHDRILMPDIRNVILMSRYVGNYHKSGFDNKEGGIELGDMSSKFPKDSDPQIVKEKILEAYAASVRELLAAGKKIYLVYPVPETGWHVTNHMFKKMMRHQNPVITTSAAVYQDRSKEVIAAFDGIGQHKNLKRIYPGKLLCNTIVPERCVTEIDGQVLYFDDDHLSVEGADILTREIFKP